MLLQTAADEAKIRLIQEKVAPGVGAQSVSGTHGQKPFVAALQWHTLTFYPPVLSNLQGTTCRVGSDNMVSGCTLTAYAVCCVSPVSPQAKFASRWKALHPNPATAAVVCTVCWGGAAVNMCRGRDLSMQGVVPSWIVAAACCSQNL